MFPAIEMNIYWLKSAFFILSSKKSRLYATEISVLQLPIPYLTILPSFPIPAEPACGFARIEKLCSFYNPIQDRYQPQNRSPQSAAINTPADKYGPSASRLFLLLTFIRMLWITDPKIHASTNASMIFLPPRISPAPAIILMSPPPIAFPEEK